MTDLRRYQLEVLVGRAFREARKKPFVDPKATVDLLEKFFDVIEGPVSQNPPTIAGRPAGFSRKFP